jgi:cytochrome c oxidase cbb3-type subunit 3
MSKPGEKILSHDYDGIKEYDNPMPGWWLFVFYASMVWALLYALFYHFGPGLLDTEAHEAEMRALRVDAARAAITADEVTDEGVLAVSASPEHVELGRALFAQRCVECHGEHGEGDIGPNLTDKYWVHGGSPSEVHATIASGVHGEGMPNWSWTIRPDEVWLAAAFVETIRSTNVKDGKEPQGLPWVPGTPSASRRQVLTATLKTVLEDPAAVSRGQAIFMTRCLPCHGPEGGGLVGPNLTDMHFIHGGDLPDLFRVVSDGVPEKGMVAWKKQLNPDELREVTVFVASLRGKNAAGKPPEGELWSPEQEAAETTGTSGL